MNSVDIDRLFRKLYFFFCGSLIGVGVGRFLSIIVPVYIMMALSLLALLAIMYVKIRIREDKQ